MVDVVGDGVEEADEGKTRDGQVWSDLKDTHALASQCLLSERVTVYCRTSASISSYWFFVGQEKGEGDRSSSASSEPHKHQPRKSQKLSKKLSKIRFLAYLISSSLLHWSGV